MPRRSLSLAALTAAALLAPAAAHADTVITAGPATGTTTINRTPTFSFVSTTLGATFECSVNGAPFAACTSPKTVSALADGPNQTFRVRDVSYGVPDASPAIRTFAVDATAPAVTIAGPAKTIDSTPTFTFTAPADGGAPYTYVCRIDGATATPCNGGTYTAPAPVSLGAHTFEVRGTDGAGNASWASHAFSRVRIKLDLPIADKPADPSAPAPAPAPQPGTTTPTTAPSSEVKPVAKKKKAAACAKKKRAKRKAAGRKAKVKARKAAAKKKTCATKNAAKKRAVAKKPGAKKGTRRG